MKEFEVTLTAVSRKTFKLRADSQEDAFLLAEAILENTDLLDFSDEDVDSMDMQFARFVPEKALIPWQRLFLKRARLPNKR